MGKQLQERLKRIKLAQVEGKLPETGVSQKNRISAPVETDSVSELFPEWEPLGYKTLRRKVLRTEGFASVKNREAFSRSLAILVPDLFRYGLSDLHDRKLENLYPENLVFFDLETTGLGGAGTVAFLAAFGRFGENGLEITQYLLLDFPGENDFIEAVLGEFSGSPPMLIVSYNGKTFDSQIIKTRCLMKGFSPPEYCHADLLHPCRRLWKRRLPDCSQGTLEAELLGIDRTGDIPGSLAPDIWFYFLRTGETADLFGICEHNLRDISGLARIFLMLGEIAANPLERHKKFQADTEALALCWREGLRRRPGVFGEEDARTAAALMDAAAEDGCPRVLRILAIEAEWKEKDFSGALGFAEKILSCAELPPGLKEETLRRRDRLVKKVSAFTGNNGR